MQTSQWPSGVLLRPASRRNAAEVGVCGVGTQGACDPAEVARIEQELARNQNNLGVGVIDKRTGAVRLFPYDETDAFSQANRHLQVAAGHEAAAAMAGIPLDQARGFVLGKQGSDWHVLNQSHLNRHDAQTNTMRMDPQTFQTILSALQGAGVQKPVLH
jgi:hypothetical protein